jgi:UDP-N-acetyl-D-glucosamine dehydrogenase
MADGLMRITVVGQGYVGLPISICAAEAGHTVFGFDTDQDKISKLKLGITDSPEVSTDKLLDLQLRNRISFSSSINDGSESSIFIIAVPTPLDSQQKPDLSFLTSACELIAQVAGPNSLIINESTSYIGTLRDLIKPIIDKLSGLIDLNYAVAPERIDPGNKVWNIKTTPRNIGGLTTAATQQTADFYSSFCDSVNVVSSPEVAECAKLFENTFRQVNIALINELSQVARKLHFSTFEAVRAAATKPFGFMPFYPSIGVGGHCIPVDPSYLSYSAELVGFDTKFIKLANQVNSSMPKIITERIVDFLGGDLIGKHVQVAGISYKPDISDLRESPALDLIRELKISGAKVSWHDPLVAVYEGQQSMALNSAVDLGLIVTPHSQIDFSIWKKANVKVLDLSANSNNYGWPKFL